MKRAIDVLATLGWMLVLGEALRAIAEPKIEREVIVRCGERGKSLIEARQELGW